MAREPMLVLCAGAARPAIQQIAARFESGSIPHAGASSPRSVPARRLELCFGPAPRLKAMMEENPPALGVVIGPSSLIGAACSEETLVAESRIALGTVQAGVALPRAAEAIDLSTPEALCRALGRADPIVFNTASSGRAIEAMLTRLDLDPEILGRIRRFETAEEAMALLGDPEGARGIGFGQASAIRGFERLGVRLAGPLPGALAIRTDYEAARARTAPDPGMAGDFLDFLQTAGSRAIFHETGLEALAPRGEPGL